MASYDDILADRLNAEPAIFNLETAVGRGAECVIFFAWQGESGPLVQ